MTNRRFYSYAERVAYLKSLNKKDARSIYELEMAKLHARFYPGPLVYSSPSAITPDGGPMVGDRNEYSRLWGRITERYRKALDEEVA